MTDKDEDGYGDFAPEENVTSGNGCDDEDAAMGQNDLDGDGFQPVMVTVTTQTVTLFPARKRRINRLYDRY